MIKPYWRLLTYFFCLFLSIPAFASASKDSNLHLFPLLNKTAKQQNLLMDNTSGNGIYYHGGLVRGTTGSTIPNVYLIWYGNWANNTATTILPEFLRGLSGSYWYNINSTYTDKEGRPVINRINFNGVSTFDNYSQGNNFDGTKVFEIVKRSIDTGNMPLDPNGLYYVVTSDDVVIPGFCKNYCGWHTYGKINNVDVSYAFIGNAEKQCPGGCISFQPSGQSPNGNKGADGLVNMMAHGLAEMVTNPMINGWYDENGFENADKCSWKFGPTRKTSTGALYNQEMNGHYYLVQQVWANEHGGYCSSGI